MSRPDFHDLGEMNMQEFAYRVIWIRERGEGDAAVEIARGVLFPGPLTHAEACTCMRKVRPYPGRRLVADYLVAEKERDATEFARAVPGSEEERDNDADGSRAVAIIVTRESFEREEA